MVQTQNRDFAELIDSLNARREELGMSFTALAERTGVSLRTVHRVLHGQDPNAGLTVVMTIANALGVRVLASPIASAQELLRRAAERKAESLASMVQATSALEAQAVTPQVRQRIKEQITNRLLAGSTRTLWAR